MAVNVQVTVPPAKMPVIYLAGAIRDNHPEDIQWRESVLQTCKGLAIFLNPLAGKTYHEDTKEWTVSGHKSGARFIVKHDFWCVDRSDIIVFNFRALSEKYPNIGTLIEFGRATGRGALLYSIVDPAYTGHGNSAMFKLHPFIEENSAAVFPTMPDAITFLKQHLVTLSGVDAHYKGGAEEGINALYHEDNGGEG
jgi:nucleoside 2-deoxyribosyltransferase